MLDYYIDGLIIIKKFMLPYRDPSDSLICNVVVGSAVSICTEFCAADSPLGFCDTGPVTTAGAGLKRNMKTVKCYCI